MKAVLDIEVMFRIPDAGTMVCADDVDEDRYHCGFAVFFVGSMSCDPWHVEELRGRTRARDPDGQNRGVVCYRPPGHGEWSFHKTGLP